MSEQIERLPPGYWRAMAAYINAVAPDVMRVANVVNDAAWDAYRTADMPYGDTHEGLLHYFDDMSKISHIQLEISWLTR